MASKSFSNPEHVAEIERRLRTLSPDSPRRWGKMSAGQALCHLSDSLRGVLGDIPPPRRADTWFTRQVVRRFALHAPLQWPHGVPTVQGLDQVAGEGTPPNVFDEDRDALTGLHERFAALTGPPPVSAHPIFGPLTHKEWMIWAYLHADHHLRQFGC